MISRILSVFLLAMVAVNHVALADEAAVKKAVQKMLGNVEVSSLKPAAAPGLYEVVYGAKVFYASEDGRYIFQGDLLDMQTQTNLTEQSKMGAVKATLATIDEKKMIVFTPEKTKHTITVFTDIDCGYCRKMHNEMDTFLKEGIRVRYMMYPRAGKKSEAYTKAVSVWCSDDRQGSLTKSKNNKAIPVKTCDHPIDEHMELAGEFGLRGTPLVILDDGSIQPGYVPAVELAKFYAQKDAAKAAKK
ncbi:MAG: DsbC family protein [Gammaproteobacteria bacterium]